MRQALDSGECDPEAARTMETSCLVKQVAAVSISLSLEKTKSMF